MMSFLWIVAIAACGIFIAVRALFDLRAKRYGWGVAGLVAAVVILMAPVPTQTVMVNPVAAPGAK